MTATAQQITGWADAIMAEIRKDMEEGTVPATVTSFSELHDYVDANMYVINVLAGEFPVPEHYGDEYADGTTLSEQDQAAVDAETDAANAVMDEVNTRLAARPLASAEVREQDARDYPHDTPCPDCGRRQWGLVAEDPGNPSDAEQETCGACGYRFSQ